MMLTHVLHMTRALIALYVYEISHEYNLHLCIVKAADFIMNGPLTYDNHVLNTNPKRCAGSTNANEQLPGQRVSASCRGIR